MQENSGLAIFIKGQNKQSLQKIMQWVSDASSALGAKVMSLIGGTGGSTIGLGLRLG